MMDRYISFDWAMKRMAYDEYIEDKRVLISVLTSSLENQRIEMEIEMERVKQQQEEAECRAEKDRKEKEEAERKLSTTIRMLREAGVPSPAIAQQISLAEEDVKRLGTRED